MTPLRPLALQEHPAFVADFINFRARIAEVGILKTLEELMAGS